MQELQTLLHGLRILEHLQNLKHHENLQASPILRNPTESHQHIKVAPQNPDES